MDRRSMLKGGMMVAAVAALAPRNAAAAAGPQIGGKTIYDYGAKGDNRTDDSAAFARAFAASYAGAGPVLVPAATYRIAETIAFTTNDHCSTPWGLIGLGATLRSAISNGRDVIRLTAGTGRQGGVPYQARYLRLSGLNITGTLKDGHGVQLVAPDAHTQNFYNCAFDTSIVQNMGGDGVVLNGNVFESSFTACNFNQNTNGLSCMHNFNGGTAQGVCSSISISDSFFIKNRNYGLQCGIIGAPYGGCTDVTVVGGYFRENGSYGAYWNNGMSRAMQNVAFENNCVRLRPDDPNGAHVYAVRTANLDNCTGWNNHGGSTNLLRGYFTAPASLTRCAQNWEGGPSHAADLGLVRIGGTSAGFVLINQCTGTVYCESNNAAYWRAVNCTGQSPLGPLDPYGPKGTR